MSGLEYGRGEMRRVLGAAASGRRTSRLPRLLFDQERDSWVAELVAHIESLAADVAKVTRELTDQKELLRRLAPANAGEPKHASPTRSYWLFVPSTGGYSMALREGKAPVARGSGVAVGGVMYRVALVGRSPFLDGRPCVYLEPGELSGIHP